ncbi:hypothetical protein MAP00_006276 [Monascus purpureus]|nr:hypothetical protein MAP00_006276 [Monascus purpureus]
MTPLEKLLLDMGPIRGDGSDKFYGMENYGNTCYCNSILQCLYYSVPFREAVVNYPMRTPVKSLEAALAQNLRYQNPNAFYEAEQAANKQRTANGPSSARSAGVPPTQPQKPEDKDSPEYKKKMALQTLPLLETTNNAESYGMSESLFTALKDIFESVAASQSRVGVVRPQQFLEVLRREHEMFRTAMHQDAHEFLNILLNEVVSNVEAEAGKLPPVENGLPQSKSADSLEHYTTSTGSKTPSTTRWVHELFEGTLTSETQCLTCENVSQRDEIFLDLSVDLEQHSSVTSCLRKFSAEEVLCERNKFHCDNCGGLQEAEKRMKIKRAPRILALHLKRFKYTEDLQRLQKLFHRVVYPYHLRLFNTTDDTEDPDRLYELYAVVVHIGGGPYHGHYVAIIKTQDRGWLLFDDEMVEPVDKNYVLNFFGDRPGLACAYVLFYQETTLEAVEKEQEMENAPPPVGSAETNGFSPGPNGQHRPVGLTHAHSAAQLPHREDVNLATLRRSPTTPVLYSAPEHPEPAVAPASPVSPTPPVPPIPSRPTSSSTPLSRTRSNIQSRFHPPKEDKERKAAEREKEKNEKLRRKEVDARSKENQRREEAQLKAAIEASRASKAEEDRRHNSFEYNRTDTFKKSNNLFRRSSKSISHVLTKEKGRQSMEQLIEKPEPTEKPVTNGRVYENHSRDHDHDPDQQHHHHHHLHLHKRRNTAKEGDKNEHGGHKWRNFSLKRKSFGILS